MGSTHPTDAQGRVLPEAGWPPGRQAHGQLERLRRFLNSTNLESGADRFETVTSALVWFADEGHPVPDRLSATDVATLRRVRELLRDVVSPGREEADRARVLLDGLTAGLVLRPRWAPGPLRLESGGTGLDPFLGWLVVTAHEATVAGTWPRLKSCRNHHCRWVYFDHSRNATGSWCATQACGARQKAKAYRRRQKGEPT